MPVSQERIPWMPSPPLAPDNGPLDLRHLKRMTLSDEGLEREVLAIFAAQSAKLMTELAELPAEAAELAHKLKGSAQAIGAFRIADAAEWLEDALRSGRAPGRALMTLDEAIAEARQAIDGILKRS
jgi:HPt (histidine-containing phosphotransfer) domain-containing protein